MARLDIDDADAIRTFALEAAAFPTLNVLVNNAGIQRPEDLRPQGEDLAAMEATVTTNLLGGSRPDCRAAKLRPTAASRPRVGSRTPSAAIGAGKAVI